MTLPFTNNCHAYFYIGNSHKEHIIFPPGAMLNLSETTVQF